MFATMVFDLLKQSMIFSSNACESNGSPWKKNDLT
jgi:hypothetical protein